MEKKEKAKKVEDKVDTEPNWKKLWDEKIGNVTYWGQTLYRCRICGDEDLYHCDCARKTFLKEKHLEWLNRHSS